MHSSPTSEINRNRVTTPDAGFDPGLLAGSTVLAVWAHPDDESYLGGGLMAAVSASGGRVVNLTATLGEHGTPDPIAMPPSQLAPVRRQELTGALSALGVSESIVLDFEDGSLADIDREMGARRMACVLDEIEPDVVMSFGPDGVTGHPDHIAIGAWVELAVAARRSRPALLQTAVWHALPTDLDMALAAAGAYFPGMPERSGSEMDGTFRLTGVDIDAKLRALRSHASQTTGLIDLLGATDYRRLAAVEAYRPANHEAWDLITGFARASAA